MMFGRKMRTKLPQNLQKKKGSDREEEARAKHDKKKEQQKKAYDTVGNIVPMADGIARQV